MRKLLIVTVVSSLTMPIFAGVAQAAGLCPSGFQVVYDINNAFCVASFNFKDGSCPSGSKLFTTDGKHLCLHNQRPQEKDDPGSRTPSEPIAITPRQIPD
jgi:hypothetical protein